MRKLGNEIAWYKPFKLVKRNRQLERLTEEQFLEIEKLKKENKELNEYVVNRDSALSKALTNDMIKYYDIKNKDINIEVLRQTLLVIKEMCMKSDSEIAKEIIKQIKID